MTLFSILIYFVTKIDYQNCHLVNPIFKHLSNFSPSLLSLLTASAQAPINFLDYCSSLQIDLLASNLDTMPSFLHTGAKVYFFFFFLNKFTLLFKSFDALHSLIKLPLLVVKILQSISCLILQPSLKVFLHSGEPRPSGIIFSFYKAILQSLSLPKVRMSSLQPLVGSPSGLGLSFTILGNDPSLTHFSGVDPGASSVSTVTAPSSML